MKLEMSLPERPGLLHALPVVNLFALMVFFLLLGPSLVLQSGVTVDPPPSRFQMQRYQETLVITMGPGEPLPHLHLGRDPITREELSERLDMLQSEGATARAIVLLQSDSGTPVGMEREISEMVLAKGFRLALVGRNAGEVRATVPKTSP